MRRITVVENVSLDGVMQAPAMPEEDTRGGFARGGWAAANMDHVAAAYMTRDAGGPGALLLGRLTFETMSATWPHMPADNPFTALINAMPKHVASTTLSGP